MQYLSTSFFNERKTKIDILMFHCSALNKSEMIETLNQNELSCHYIIEEDGNITRVVRPDRRAWHGGVGFWRGIDTDINSHSIGIELCHPTLGQTAYSENQINSLIKLSKQLIRRYNIKPQNIIGHSDSSPTRKPDPGKCFPWQDLAQKGISLWYDIHKTSEITDIQQLLSSIGYDTRSTEAVKASLYAFARRFVPNLIPTDNNIQHLVDNVYPDNINFINNKDFIKILQAVSYSFND